MFGGLKVIENAFLTKSVPMPNRPRIKKKNKRATRLYWKRQPKWKTVPSEDVYHVGDSIVCHPEMARKIIAAIDAMNAEKP